MQGTYDFSNGLDMIVWCVILAKESRSAGGAVGAFWGVNFPATNKRIVEQHGPAYMWHLEWQHSDEWQT